MKFNVRFTINRFPFRNMYRAIETMASLDNRLESIGSIESMASLESIANLGKGYVFPQEMLEVYNAEEVEIPRSFFNRDIDKNHEQKLAVRKIIPIKDNKKQEYISKTE